MLEENPRRIKIIVNPNAGGGNGRKLFPLLRQKLLDRKLSFNLQFSESGEQAAFLTRQAQGEGYNILAVCGGDGTANRVLQSVAGTRTALAVIPMGKGNDFARSLGIEEDLDQACDLLQTGRLREVDIIEVNSGKYMMGTGGVGFDSEVNALADKLPRFLSVKALYAIPILWKGLTYRTKEILLRLDSESLQGPVLMVAFGNVKSYGGGMQILPLAESNDGLMDICWIDPVKKMRFYRLFPTVYAGGHIDLPEVHYYRSTFAKVESPVPLDFYGDGELLGQTPLTLRVVPRGLRVLAPC